MAPVYYHSVALDEERPGRGGGEKSTSTRTPAADGGLFAALREGLARYGVWLGHALLLSTSITLFTVSLCMRDGRPSALKYTQQYSSYCTSLARPPARINFAVETHRR